MSILVTGGAGFIGSHLCEKLLLAGEKVIAVDDFNDYYAPEIKRKNIAACLKSSNFALVEDDIRSDLSGVFKKYQLTQIVHLAARAGVRPSLTTPKLYVDVNVIGTVNLLEHCKNFGVKKFIFGSSSSVYGVNSKTPFSEDDPLNHPISPYAISKISGEQLCRIYHDCFGINVVCLRFFTVYGPRQRPEMAIHKFVRLIRQGRPIPFYGDGDSGRDYTYITDIIQGITSALKRDFGYEIINLGDSRVVPLKELVSIIEKETGKKAKLEPLGPQSGDVPVTYADIAKAERLLQYKPEVGIKEGVSRFVKWSAENEEIDNERRE